MSEFVYTRVYWAIHSFHSEFHVCVSMHEWCDLYVCACVRICMYACACVKLCVCVCAYMHVHLHIYVCAYYVSTYPHKHVHVYHMYLHAHMHAYILHIHVCLLDLEWPQAASDGRLLAARGQRWLLAIVHIHTYTYTHTHTHIHTYCTHTLNAYWLHIEWQRLIGS